MTSKSVSIPLGFGRLYLGCGYLPHNSHRMWKRLLGGRWDYDHAPMMSTWQVVEMGKDSWNVREGRKSYGWRLWLYGWRGQCVNLDVIVRFKRCPYPPGHRYGFCELWW